MTQTHFVLATNRTETVRDFVGLAFKAADINVEFKGAAENENCSRSSNW